MPTQVSTSNPMTISAAFERVVRLYPTHEAVVDSAARLTFEELDDLSRRLVTLLREQGVRPGARVALLTLPSAIHLVAWVAVVRAGAIPVALHTREAAPLLGRLCDKLDVELVLHDSSFASLVEAIRASSSRSLHGVAVEYGDGGSLIVRVPSGTRALTRHPAAEELARAAEDDAAVVILSSGTTSLPKGVVHSHRGLVDAARTAMDMYVALRPGSRIIVPYSTAFTASYATWLPFLNAGACSVFLEKFELADYLATIRRERVTHMSLTPTMWRKLLTLEPDPTTYASVVQAQFAAEPMDSNTLKLIRDTVSPNVAQAYGSTETLGWITVNVVDDMHGDRLRSVGRPFVNAEVRIVRREGQPEDVLPAGEVGEVMATSPSVALGIWGDDAATARLFHTDREGRRWWRSSDLGRLDNDGFLYLEGRSDDMIISGGINIMPNAVEEVLLGHPSVDEVAVVGLPHPEWGQQVHAFVVARGARLKAEDLDGFVLESSLAGYQRPREYHLVESLPRTATNKLNRRALRDLWTETVNCEPKDLAHE